MERDKINKKIITYVLNGGYDSDDFEKFKSDYLYENWTRNLTDGFNEANGSHNLVSTADLNKLFKEAFNMAFDENEKKKVIKEAFMKCGLEKIKMYSKEALEYIFNNTSFIVDYAPNEMESLFEVLYDCYTETDDKEEIEQYNKEIEENKKRYGGNYSGYKEKLPNGNVLFCNIFN